MDLKRLKEFAKEEMVRMLTIFFYLWLLFALFNLHEYLVLAQVTAPYFKFGVSAFNALVFAKVMLLAEKIPIASWMRTKPLAVPILARAVCFAILFMLAHLIESIIEGLFHHEKVMDSLPSYGGGFLGALATAIIIAVSLIPFLAFEELELALGQGTLRGLLLTPRPATPELQAAVDALEAATHKG